MRFQVPQFIDVEDKIFGPFTLKQFIYLAGGASVAVIATTLFGFFIGIILALPIMVLAVGLAFYRVNNRPFIHTVESAFSYFMSNKLYIWKKKEEKKETESEEKKYSSIIVPHLSESKLKDLSWELDVKNKGEEDKVSG